MTRPCPSGPHGRRLAIAAAVLASSVGVLAVDATPSVASAPPVRTITFEIPSTPGEVVLGALASRSQANPVTGSGTGPYTVTGTDSRTGQPYTFVSDQAYGTGGVRAGWAREGRQGTIDDEEDEAFFDVDTSASHLGRDGVLMLSSEMQCANRNNEGGITAYCSVFGPQVWSAPFQAETGEAIAFDWSAVDEGDHYEWYGFLVAVEEAAPPTGGAASVGYDYGSDVSHTLVAYGRGSEQAWTTSTAIIPAGGTYRFRFVNGSYDASGGLWLGAYLYLEPDIQVGLANPITLEAPPAANPMHGPVTVTASAPAGPVTLTSATPRICSVVGTQVRFTGVAGTCSVQADQPGGGAYVPAQTTYASITVSALPPVVINPGGGELNDGSDGIEIVLNETGIPDSICASEASACTVTSHGSDQVTWRNLPQYHGTGGSPVLNVGGTLFGLAGAATDEAARPWGGVEILGMTGSATHDRGADDASSGGARLRYTAVKGGRLYTVVREVAYTYPNRWFTDRYTVTVPAGNTETVRLYQVADTAAGWGDQRSFLADDGVRLIGEISTTTETWVGYRETHTGPAFDGAATGHPWDLGWRALTNDDLGFSATEDGHDGAIAMQWNVGSAAGTSTFEQETVVGNVETTLDARFFSAEAEVGEAVVLDLTLLNATDALAGDVGFTFTLPVGLTIAGVLANRCGATLDTVPGQRTITVTEASVAPGASCVIEAAVTAASPGEYVVSSASASALSGAENAVGTTSLQVLGASPPPTTVPVPTTVAPAPTTAPASNAPVTTTPPVGTTPVTTAPATTLAPVRPRTPGLAGNGAPIAFADGAFRSVPTPSTPTPPVGAALTPSGNGMLVIDADGKVSGSGDAKLFGDLADVKLNAPAVGIVTTGSGNGYWIVTADGGVFAFGDAPFKGNAVDLQLNGKVRSITPTCGNDGYYLVAEDGGVFAYGDANFLGSMAGVRLNDVMIGIIPACDGSGYWTWARDGGVFAYGGARFYGSLADRVPPGGVIAMASTPTGSGYWLIGADRSVHAFGDAAGFVAPAGVPTAPDDGPASLVRPAAVLPERTGRAASGRRLPNRRTPGCGAPGQR